MDWSQGTDPELEPVGLAQHRARQRARLHRERDMARGQADVDERRAPMALYTRWVNYLNLAALAVPSTVSSGGLPMSLQIVVRRLEEPLALRIGRAFETARGAFPRPPARA